MTEEHTTVVHLVGCACELCEAREEIKWLRNALALAVEEMSTSGEYSYLSFDQLMEHLLQEARRG